MAPGAVFGAKRAAKSRASHQSSKETKPTSTWRSGKRLAVILLQGGPDGLSLVAPTRDPLYRYLRPTTALDAGPESLDLGDGFLLHPALSTLFPLWKRNRLLVIPACGLPGAPTDHAGAMAAFAAGSASQKRSGNGWLGRLSLALGGSSGQMLVASQSPVYKGAPHYKMLSAGRSRPLPSPVVAQQELIEEASRLFGRHDPLTASFASGRRTEAGHLRQLLAESRRAADDAVTAPTFAAFGERLGREMAERRDAALAFTAVGGFDTHVGQGTAKGYLADRLHETAEGLAGLVSGLGRAFDDTVVVALGEFGRRARENDFGGTDNGQGGVMFVLGGPVAGGRRLGVWPGLSEHRLADGRDVAVTTDWRDVVAEIAVKHLGLPEKRLGDIFPGFTPPKSPLGILG